MGDLPPPSLHQRGGHRTRRERAHWNAHRALGQARDLLADKAQRAGDFQPADVGSRHHVSVFGDGDRHVRELEDAAGMVGAHVAGDAAGARRRTDEARLRDRKSTRLNSSHEWISYAVFCLKKKKKKTTKTR